MRNARRPGADLAMKNSVASLSRVQGHSQKRNSADGEQVAFHRDLTHCVKKIRLSDFPVILHSVVNSQLVHLSDPIILRVTLTCA